MTEFFLPLAFFRPSFTGFNKIIKVFSISIGKTLLIQITFLWILMDMYPDLLMLTFLSNYFVLYLIKRKSVTFYLNFFSKYFDVDFFQQLLRVVPDQKARRWKEWNWSLNFENNAFVAI